TARDASRHGAPVDAARDASRHGAPGGDGSRRLATRRARTPHRVALGGLALCEISVLRFS
ncbi:MAG: hypothetical protein ACOY0T_01365, partial [Myxococcota bacterium]